MKFSHLDEKGALKMVDISGKKFTARTAVAEGCIKLSRKTLDLIKDKKIPKGDVIACAKAAGILAAKRVAELIPLTHQINLSHIGIDISPDISGLKITASAKTNCATGVEMEALTAVAVAALTLYDMIKSVEKSAEITGIRLVAKTGGKSDYKR